MITKTTIIAIRTLIQLGQDAERVVRSPRALAEDLAESPSYTAKVTGLLVKAGILRAEKGVRGGVYLAKATSEVTLLDIVQACQGALVGDYCQPGCNHKFVCAYHAAAEELHDAMVGVLSKWTLERLMKKPAAPKVEQLFGLACLMAGGQNSLEMR